MKKIILVLSTFFLCINLYSQSAQSRSAGNVVINWNVGAWIARSPASFAANDNVYAYTKSSSGQHPLFFDHFGFTIPTNATINKIEATVRKFKSGKSEVKDYPGITWFIKGCCNYGPSMNDLSPWKTTETAVIYQQPGTGVDEKGKSYSWTPADINDPLFGFTFNPTVSIKGGGAAIYIDQVQITVYYSTSSNITKKLESSATEFTFDAKVLSNPTNVNFQISTTSGTNDPITIRTVDVFGRLVELRTNVIPNSIHRIGDAYAPGLYFAEITQGTNRKVLRLVKN